jgi:uncharacterized protein DUF5916
MKRHLWLTLLLVGAVAFGAAAAAAAPSGPRPLRGGIDGPAVARALSAPADPSSSAPPSLDVPHRASGESATDPSVGASLPGLEVTDFRQNEPGDGEPVSEPTKAYVSFDQDNLHVVFVCEDDPARVRANVVPRERITDDDRVGIFLDTFDDNQRAYAFLVNPLGIQRDGILTEGQDDDWTFDALWYSEGHLTPSGYVVKMRIPFSSLRFAKKSAQTWGLGLVRYIERKSEKSYWPHITERVEGFVNQLGSANGIAEISPGRRFVLVPYSVMTNSRFLDQNLDVPAFRRLREGRLGLDAKAVLHDAVTLDVAVNPDFSQIQPDDPQVTVNQRFEVRVEEKRPFFVENAGYFQTPIELFFSRRIQDPRAGARLTSKLGHWAIGGLFMDDREPGLVPASDPMHGEHAYAGVLRAQGEIGGSTVGLFASSRALAGGFNRVFSADARFKLGKNWVASGQAVQAHTGQPGEPRVWGGGGYLKVKRSGRYFDFSTNYTQLSPAFAADLGFIRRVGFREVETSSDYTFRPKKRLVTAWGPSLSASWNWAWDGRLQDAAVAASAKVEMPANTVVEVGWEEIFELFRDQEFRLRTHSILAETDWLKWLSISASYKRGTDVNHDPLKKVTPFAGNAQETEMSVAVRPTSRMEFKQGLTYGWLHHGLVDPTLGPVTRPVFTNWILSSKLKYQINRELSLRAIANYEAVVPNPALSREDEARIFVPDFLVTYLVNPWTALHAGYTERFENLRLESGEVVTDPPSLEEFRLPRTSVDRQFFVKISYLMGF